MQGKKKTKKPLPAEVKAASELTNLNQAQEDINEQLQFEKLISRLSVGCLFFAGGIRWINLDKLYAVIRNLSFLVSRVSVQVSGIGNANAEPRKLTIALIILSARRALC